MTKLIPIGTMISAVINILVNAVLIPKYSIWGAAVSSLISHIFLFCIHHIFAKFVSKKQYEYRMKIFIPGIAVLTLFSIAYFVLKDLWMVRYVLALGIAGYLVYGIVRNKSIF